MDEIVTKKCCWCLLPKLQEHQQQRELTNTNYYQLYEYEFTNAISSFRLDWEARTS